MPQERQYEDLAWLAFCYQTDELSADEAQAFEARLATDQAAREALAEAVLLSQAVLLAPRETRVATDRIATARMATRQDRRLHRRFGWVALVVAACVAVVLLSDSWLARENVRPIANHHNDSLALAWASSEVSLDSVVASDVELLAALDDTDPGDADTGQTTGQMTVPDWMLEAVSTRSGVEIPDPSKES